MSIEVAIPLFLLLVCLYVLTEANSKRITNLQKRVKELENTEPHYNGHWEEHKKRWPREDR